MPPASVPNCSPTHARAAPGAAPLPSPPCVPDRPCPSLIYKHSHTWSPSGLSRLSTAQLSLVPPFETATSSHSLLLYPMPPPCSVLPSLPVSSWYVVPARGRRLLGFGGLAASAQCSWEGRWVVHPVCAQPTVKSELSTGDAPSISADYAS